MGKYIGIGRKARQCFGFDDVALVPGSLTINPDDVNVSWEVGGRRFDIPVVASAMDGVVDVRFAAEFGRLGGFAVLNLEGVQTRFADPSEVLDQIAAAAPEKSTQLLQKLYTEPIKKVLIGRRVEEIKAGGAPAVVSAIPQRAAEFGPLAAEAGCDIFVVQSTVATVEHESSSYESLDFTSFIAEMHGRGVPVMVGNTTTFEVSYALMETGADGIFCGVGPGAACTTRGVLGIGVPQITTTVDCAYARDRFYKMTGRYVPVVTDGGMRVGGDICKAFAAGADAVMLGSPFARALEAPGRGYHWGMATPHANLPRGTRVHVGQNASLEQILFGPAGLDDGSQNLVGALRTSMGNVGAHNIREMQNTEIIIAPAIQTEGKLLQKAQRIGMAK
ncbi:MAG TPA: GuaB3 family IMP dehydrogenase-related protein [Candidatus Coatesbacteria bacterium]|nr:GuaB3 family IMP dehydrogenase-related protein [Candidatus Coatesbacteria bacterium]